MIECFNARMNKLELQINNVKTLSIANLSAEQAGIESLLH